MADSRPTWASILQPVTQANGLKDKHSKKNASLDSLGHKALENVGDDRRISEEVHKQGPDVSTDEIGALRIEKLGLETRLNEALKKLVILQPRQETSDELIKQLYEELCQNVEDCADSDSTDVVNLGERTTSVYWTPLEVSTVFRHFTQDDAQLSKSFPEINSNILMSTVFSWLFEICLNEDKWCCAGPPQEEILLSTVLEAIVQQNPTGGIALSNRWRAETYLALSSLPDRMERQKEMIWTANGHICHILNKLTGRPVNYANFREKILYKAFRLAHLMRSSVTRYTFNFPPVSATNDVLLKQDQTESYRLLDAHTGVGVDVTRLIDYGEMTGKLRLCVFPGLSKVQEDGNLVLMVKAVVVLDRSNQLNASERSDESDKKMEESDVKPTESGEKWEATEAKLEGTIKW